MATGRSNLLEEVRAFALALPEVTEEPHFEKASFRVRGKIFATMPQGGAYLHVFVDEWAVQSCVTDDPAAYEELTWGGRLAGLRINLGMAQAQPVLELVEEAWRRKAPKRLQQLRIGES